MEGKTVGKRGLRFQVGELLEAPDFQERLDLWTRWPPKKVINPLLSFMYSLDPVLQGRAVTAIGVVMNKMADENMEQARDIMRRLMWNLNDESGCSGWGSGEAMGEIMARHGGLAGEYHRILASYISHEGNHLGNDLLERGVLWGLGRLAQKRPELVQRSVEDLVLYLKSQDPHHRGLACRVLSHLQSPSAVPALKELLKDEEIIPVFHEGKVEHHKIGDLARMALN